MQIKRDSLFLTLLILISAINCGKKMSAKLKTQQCPAFTAEQYQLSQGWGCSDAGWTFNQGSAKITFQAKGNDWYIGGFNGGNLQYFIVFVGWNNSATKVLNSGYGTIGNCQAPMSIRSDVVYNYVITIDGPTGQIKIDVDQGIAANVFNKDNFQSPGGWRTVFQCQAGAALLQSVQTFRLSCFCQRPSDTVVTLYNYKKLPVVPGQPDFSVVEAKPPGPVLVTPTNKCLKPFYQ